jgi:hypothetical protein
MIYFFQILIGVGLVNTILGGLQSVKNSEISILLIGGLIMIIVGFGGVFYVNRSKAKS